MICSIDLSREYVEEIGLKHVLLDLGTGVMQDNRQLSGIVLFTKYLLNKDVIAPASFWRQFFKTKGESLSRPEDELVLRFARAGKTFSLETSLTMGWDQRKLFVMGKSLRRVKLFKININGDLCFFCPDSSLIDFQICDRFVDENRSSENFV